MLSARHYRFVLEYCKDENASRAALSAGYSEASAGQLGHQLLKKVEIQQAIRSRNRDIAEAARATDDRVTMEILEIFERGKPYNCRYCWGIDHAYQWTEREYERELTAALKAGAAAPNFSGGFGFIKKGEINEDCPECKGKGQSYELPADDKDRLKAADLLQKRLGVQIQKSEISGPGGAPIQIDPTAKVDDLSNDQLKAIIAYHRMQKGTIEGTLSLPDENGIRMSQLPSDVNP